MRPFISERSCWTQEIDSKQLSKRSLEVMPQVELITYTFTKQVFIEDLLYIRHHAKYQGYRVRLT